MLRWDYNRVAELKGDAISLFTYRMAAAKQKSKRLTSSSSPDSRTATLHGQRGHFVLYPCGGAFNKLRATQESRYLHELLDNNIEGYYDAENRRLFIINNILSKIPGGLRAWDKTEKLSVQLDEEDAYRRVAQKIRDMKKNHPNLKDTSPPPDPPTRRAAKRKSFKVDSVLQSETQTQVKKTKVVRKVASKPASKPVAKLAPRPKSSFSAPSDTVPRKSPMRDITPDQVKDELIVTLREEIDRLRGLVRDQDMELHALRMLKGSPMVDGM